jgi:uncharacterized protein involved in tolerance to divalent cations
VSSSLQANGNTKAASTTRTLAESIPEGGTVQCIHDNGRIYRWVNQELCEYPNTNIASTWDEYWREDIMTVDCTSLTIGIPMVQRTAAPNTNEEVVAIIEGRTVQCLDDNQNLYRWTKGQLRLYPSGPIATSWDDNWRNFQTVDCTSLTFGSPMLKKGLVEDISKVGEGKTVQCYGDDQNRVFRWTLGLLRHYTTGLIATSWDENWRTSITIVDCTSLEYGSPMLKKGITSDIITSVTNGGGGSSQGVIVNIVEGEAIQCENDNQNLYRWTDGELRLYPTGSIATSWDDNWRNFQTVDCTSLTIGSPMVEKTVSGTLAEGQTVQCLDDIESLYRWTNSKLRLYPSGSIASSWDENWRDSIKRVDCSSLAVGSPMLEKFVTIEITSPPDGIIRIPEGEAVQCLGDGENVFRWTDNKLRQYTSSTIASSWDENWSTSVQVVDCTLLVFGSPMLENGIADGIPSITEGKTVQCDDDIQNIYRWTDGQLRLYPDGQTASSWDENWRSFQKVDCTHLAFGSPMIKKVVVLEFNSDSEEVSQPISEEEAISMENMIIITEGGTVECEGDNQNIYRWTNNQLRLYPNGPIASSWNKNWRDSIVIVDCTSLVFASPMEMKTITIDIDEGRAVQCEGAPCIFRWTNGQLRPYAGPSVASSWDENWRNSHIMYDCTDLPLGSPMLEKGIADHIIEGGTVKCDDGDQNLYRWTNDQLRHYTSVSVASSWNENWQNLIQIVDCTVLPFGSPMLEKGLPDIVEGRAVQCDGDDEDIYRWVHGQLRLYPSAAIASLWDQTWRNFILKTDCTSLSLGSPMLDIPQEGETVQCEGDDLHFYRWTNGQLRSYPNDSIASSWDENWSNSVQIGDCRVLPFGSPLSAYGLPDILEGRTVQCDNDNINVYRWTNDQLRLYPNTSIASSWNTNWRDFIQQVDCTFLTVGSPMLKKEGMITITEGRSVQCLGDEQNMYRWTGGQLRLYPSTIIASSWDENWRNFVKIDCTSRVFGSAMIERSVIEYSNEEDISEGTIVNIIEGRSVKCLGDEEKIYRWTNDQLRLYQSGSIASSWDENWRESIKTVDCTSLTIGAPMLKKESIVSITEGRAVQCINDTQSIYRWTNGLLRVYPDSTIATSWDENWRNYLKVDCTSLTVGIPMVKNVVIVEGSCVQCLDNNQSLYRWTDGELRLYPSGPIATSWDDNWRNFQTVDCSSLTIGSPMVKNVGILEGRCVRCLGDNQSLYRWTNGELRLYPSGPIATSWDDNWRNFQTVDCTSLTIGSPMVENALATNTSGGNLPTDISDGTSIDNVVISEGMAVQCLGEEQNIYRWTGDLLRLYPNGQILNSWDSNWRNTLEKIDCTSLTIGNPMLMKGSIDIVVGGVSVQCLNDSEHIYRLTNSLRHYPSGPIATSWDTNWRNFQDLDCTFIPIGSPMSKREGTLDLSDEGLTVRCLDDDQRIYRWTNNQLRLYPSGPIAASWNENWRNFQNVNCTSLSIGSPMSLKGEILRGIAEGSAIRCSNDVQSIYRWTEGLLRLYPSGPIATSWDKNWRNFKSIDCTSMTIGSPMVEKGSMEVVDGLPVRCLDDTTRIYRLMKTLRLYPSGPIATSWDPEWRNFETIDCSFLSIGSPMMKKGELSEGSAVQCLDDVEHIYRWSNGELRLYPNGPIASMWDENWRSFKKVDCTSLVYGPIMTSKI